jgi:hypothetical protein
MPSGISFSNIRLYVFIDGMRHVGDTVATRGQPDFQHPKAVGSFHLDTWVSTSTPGPRGRERCTKVETGGELIVVGEGLYAHRERITFTPNRAAIRRTLKAWARIGPIELEALSL